MSRRAYYVDEFKEDQVSFSFERAYKNFKVYFNEEHLGTIEGGMAALKKGVMYNSADGNTIYVQLMGKEKLYINVEYNGIPIPSSPHYPVKAIKKAANWVMGFGILTAVIGVILMLIYPLLTEHWAGYIMPAIGLSLIGFYFGIRRYHSPALWIPLVLFCLDLVTDLFASDALYGTGKSININLGTFLKVAAISAMIRAVKPMRQMQAVKQRLRKRDQEDLLDTFEA